MSHRIISDEDTECIFVRFEDKVTLDEILDVIDLLVAEPAYRAITRRLHDYSRADGTLSAAEVKRLAAHIRTTRSSLTTAEQEQRRSAALLSSDLKFGLGRMAAAFFEGPSGNPFTDFHVVRTYAEAAEYLGLPSPDYDPFERP